MPQASNPINQWVACSPASLPWQCSSASVCFSSSCCHQPCHKASLSTHTTQGPSAACVNMCIHACTSAPYVPHNTHHTHTHTSSGQQDNGSAATRHTHTPRSASVSFLRNEPLSWVADSALPVDRCNNTCSTAAVKTTKSSRKVVCMDEYKPPAGSTVACRYNAWTRSDLLPYSCLCCAGSSTTVVSAHGLLSNQQLCRLLQRCCG